MANRLADSTSPYLLQHADNPVDWWPWGDEALERARQRDVPLLISIGYAACHWCHVMARESFADPELAAVINAGTVPIKVDREERPDIDAVYLQATVAMTGQGGWPTTVFATPDGTPFYAGTYYPPPQLRQLLDAVTRAWTDRRQEVEEQGAAVVQACAGAAFTPVDVTAVCPIGGPCPPVSPVEPELLDRASAALLAARDPANGGFGGAPKFPTQPALDFLVQHHRRTADPDTLAAVASTGERMARGGIHDQLAGGFARYAVDATWTVPHFEKMLYDNAVLLDTYLDLAELTGRQEFFGGVADGIADFLLTDLTTDEGGFAAALDADTAGHEGATYVWTPDQLVEVLGTDEGRWAAEVFAVTAAGTFERGTSVLQLPTDPDDPVRLGRVRRQLLAARRGRPQPARDDKVVTAWNGLAVAALSRYAERRHAPRAAAAADRAARLLADVHLSGGRVLRVSRHGTAGDAAGVLEDHAALAIGFLARYSADGDGRWLELAGQVMNVVTERFTDATGHLTDTADDAEVVVTRLTDPTDGPTPSGSALAAGAFVRLAAATGDERYADQAWRTVAGAAPLIEQHPRFAGGLAAVAEQLIVDR